MSIKGGTGKSLCSVNLAYALSRRGGTALIDCDIDSSNLAEFIGDIGRIEVTPDKRFKPLEWNGVKVWSISLLAEKWRPISLTGDKYVSILNDVVHYCDWGDVDFMVLDLPSGSHDSWRGAVYLFAESYVGDVVVIQPAFPDNARRVLNLHVKNDVPVVGLIENMSYFVCPDHEEPKVYRIFGESLGEKIAGEYGIPFLGEIPIIPDLQDRIKSGKPILEEYSGVFEKAADIIANIPVEKIGLIRRVKEKVAEATRDTVVKILGFMLSKIGTSIKIPEDFRYYEDVLCDFVVLSNDWSEVLCRLHLKPKEGRLVYVKNPKNVDYEVHMPFKTLARVIMGVKKTREGKLIPYDALDAYFNNELEVYGEGSTQRVIDLVRNTLLREDVMSEARRQFPFLERYV
jgi:Mrp family chromosome partitioning ATPase